MNVSKRIAFTVIVALIIITASWLYVPRNPTPVFAQAVKNSERIVIRDGGFDCCEKDIDSQQILHEITDPVRIADFNANIVFRRSISSKSLGRCSCCGYPGIDWYQDGKRILLTSVQHGKALRWSEFDTDEYLTDKSAARLNQFFSTHGILKCTDTLPVAGGISSSASKETDAMDK